MDARKQATLDAGKKKVSVGGFKRFAASNSWRARACSLCLWLPNRCCRARRLKHHELRHLQLEEFKRRKAAAAAAKQQAASGRQRRPARRLPLLSRRPPALQDPVRRSLLPRPHSRPQSPRPGPWHGRLQYQRHPQLGCSRRSSSPRRCWRHSRAAAAPMTHHLITRAPLAASRILQAPAAQTGPAVSRALPMLQPARRRWLPTRCLAKCSRRRTVLARRQAPQGLTLLLQRAPAATFCSCSANTASRWAGARLENAARVT